MGALFGQIGELWHTLARPVVSAPSKISESADDAPSKISESADAAQVERRELGSVCNQ